MRRFTFAVLVAMLMPAEAPAAASSAPPDDPSHSCVMIQSTRRMRDGAEASGTGTGFLIDRDLVLTCNHLLNIPTPHGVVEAQRVEVQVGPKKFVRARIEQRDQATDLAILKLDEPVAEGRRPLYMCEFNLTPRSPVQIIGNFPDQIRTTRGALITPVRSQGFALSSAKVYSGFSGGPILDKDGAVQGILSQRDDYNNSIFVRSDVVLSFLQQYATRSGRDIACFSRMEQAPMDLGPVAEPVDGTAVALSVKPAPRAEAEPDEVVVALPVRPSAGTFVSKNTQKKK